MCSCHEMHTDKEEEREQLWVCVVCVVCVVWWGEAVLSTLAAVGLITLGLQVKGVIWPCILVSPQAISPPAVGDLGATRWVSLPDGHCLWAEAGLRGQLGIWKPKHWSPLGAH